MTFLILLWIKLVLVCFSFLLTSWPCTKCQCQTKTGRKSSSISCLASLHPSTPLFLLLLWNTDTLTGLWIVDDTMAVFGSLLMLRLLYSSEIFSNLHETTLWCFEKICFRFTKGFKEKHWFFCNISCVGNKKEPKDRTCCIFQKKPVTNEPGLQYYSRCNIRRSVTYIIFFVF